MARSNIPLDEIKERANDSLARQHELGSEDIVQAKRLVEELRNVREYELMGRLAEAVSRRDPRDARNRRLYAQYLIDTGKATAAIDVLKPLTRGLEKAHPERIEATGLLGRAYKQIFFDTGDKASPEAQHALKKAIGAYRKPWEDSEANTWHGVNLVALLSRARRLGLRVARDLEPTEVARTVVATLEATPKAKRDEWFLPVLTEAYLGLNDWDTVERCLKDYVAAEDARAFQVASTLRQFTEVWDLENTNDRGKGLVNILRARLARLPGGDFELSPEELRHMNAEATPSNDQLEAILGDDGPKTYQWWRRGLATGVSVAAVRQKLGRRVGTGFLVRAGDLGLEPGEELLILTNFHVVNPEGASPGIRPEEAEVVFEAMGPPRTYAVREIVWHSPIQRHDASLLRLEASVEGVDPLALAPRLPALESTARVYVIGHAGGRELAFSFQDNELLDHEGPPNGKPQVEGVHRLHYRTPTEQGSSGSPVFNAIEWKVIALHHMGLKEGMPRLNGQPGTYAANEGIAIHSILQALGQA